MIRQRLHRQDGMIRDVVKYLALIVVIMVIVLDGVAVIQAQLSVRQQATDAASAAREVYAETGSEKLAKAKAESYLTERDSEYIGSSLESAGGRASAVVVVTAERHADTFLYRHLVGLPWVGDRIDNLLNPVVTGETDKSNI